MINLNLLQLFSLIELIVVLVVAVGVLFWKWRRLKKANQTLDKAWGEAKISLESSLAALGQQEGDVTSHKRECLKGFLDMFDREPSLGIAHWNQACATLLLALEEVELKFGQEGEEVDRILPEMECFAKGFDKAPEELVLTSLDTIAEQRKSQENNYQEMQMLMGEQSDTLEEFQEYKSKLVRIVGEFQRIASVNSELQERLKTVSSPDLTSYDVQKMLAVSEQNDRELLMMVAELDQENNQIEPKINALTLHNKHLVNCLIHYRKQMDKVFQQNTNINSRLEEVEKLFDMRNKSYDRLYTKYGALRQEYITLYDLFSKSKPAKGSAIVKGKNDF